MITLLHNAVRKFGTFFAPPGIICMLTVGDSDWCRVPNWQIGAREDCVETAVDIAPKRDNLLQQLLAILNSDILLQRSTQLSDDDIPPSVVLTLSVLSASLSQSRRLPSSSSYEYLLLLRFSAQRQVLCTTTLLSALSFFSYLFPFTVFPLIQAGSQIQAGGLTDCLCSNRSRVSNRSWGLTANSLP